MQTKLSENVVEDSAHESYLFPDVDFDGLRQRSYWPMFELGEICVSPLVAEALTVADLEHALHQHGLGSWGMLGPSDWRANDFCLDARSPVLSIYKAENGTIFTVHTDFDRQLTEILLPREL